MSLEDDVEGDGGQEDVGGVPRVVVADRGVAVATVATRPDLLGRGVVAVVIVVVEVAVFGPFDRAGRQRVVNPGAAPAGHAAECDVRLTGRTLVFTFFLHRSAEVVGAAGAVVQRLTGDGLFVERQGHAAVRAGSALALLRFEHTRRVDLGQRALGLFRIGGHIGPLVGVLHDRFDLTRSDAGTQSEPAVGTGELTTGQHLQKDHSLRRQADGLCRMMFAQEGEDREAEVMTAVDAVLAEARIVHVAPDLERHFRLTIFVVQLTVDEDGAEDFELQQAVTGLHDLAEHVATRVGDHPVIRALTDQALGEHLEELGLNMGDVLAELEERKVIGLRIQAVQHRQGDEVLTPIPGAFFHDVVCLGWVVKKTSGAEDPRRSG